MYSGLDNAVPVEALFYHLVGAVVPGNFCELQMLPEIYVHNMQTVRKVYRGMKVVDELFECIGGI